MPEKKKTFKEWVTEHKTELIIAGISLTTILAVIVGIREHDELEDAVNSLRRLFEKTTEKACTMNDNKDLVSKAVSSDEMFVDGITTTERAPHSVCEHVRNLPDGQHPSIEKVELAAEHGFELMPGQTWVDSYSTGGYVA